MKTIYLLRHAKSVPRDRPMEDIDRPLSARGRDDAAAMAVHLAEAGIEPALVLCSSARRTRETLERAMPGLSPKAAVVIEEELYDAESDDLLRRLHGIEGMIGSVMLIGHNPAMEDLARRLVNGGDAAAEARLRKKFPTGALAVLEAAIDDWRDLDAGGAKLTAFVAPKDLR